VGIVEDIPMRIRNSFVPVDFVVLEMYVCRQIPLILGRPFLSTAGAMIDIAARIIKLNISGKEETFTFKSKGTEQCNQVMESTTQYKHSTYHLQTIKIALLRSNSISDEKDNTSH
jgi:hypothetical protein